MRYSIKDPEYSFSAYEITDSKTLETRVINFAWVGKNMDKTGTWDYAPLSEMSEIDGGELEKFRIRLHQDDKFVRQQLIMNRRQDIWWDKHKTEKIKVRKQRRGTDGYSTLHTEFDYNLLRCIDVDGKKFLFSGSLKDKKVYETHPEWLIESKAWEIITKFKREQQKAKKLISRFMWKMKLNLSSEDYEFHKAHKKSIQLLRQWMAEDELRWLIHQGELSINHDDETFIIKKDPYSTVKVVDKEKNKKEYCMVLKNHGGTNADLLLAKILMIKTNPKKFKEIAILRS